MIDKKLARKVATGGAVFAAALTPAAAAFAQEAVATKASPASVLITRAAAAAVTMSVSAFAAGYAQSKIGAAAAGTLAERPEAGINLIVLQALPEIIVLMGFVIAFMINAAA